MSNKSDLDERPIDLFFKKLNTLGLSVTFDDVLLKSGRKTANTMPKNIDVSTYFSKNIPLKIPISSAAMDTVTEYAMATELAKLGGIGIIHKNLTPEEQATQVKKVKMHLNGFVDSPMVVYENQTITEVNNMKAEKGFEFSSFPVLSSTGKLTGIVSSTNFVFSEHNNQTMKEIMSRKLITGNSRTSLEDAYNIMMKERVKILPILKYGKEFLGIYTFKDVKRIKQGNSPLFNVDDNNQLIVGAAIGTGKYELERAEFLIKKGVDVLVLDTAHGDSKPVYETLSELKNNYSNIDVVVGNISQPESAINLAKAGADGIKVGQGGGSICTTRVISGMGNPQLTAVYDCTMAVSSYNIPIISDGGIVQSGDITKAIAAGAHSVMVGSMLAATAEAPGELIFLNGEQWKSYRGMGSLGAMQTNVGSRDRYNQGETAKSDLIPEGIEGLKKYKGNVERQIVQQIGGLKSGMGYVGAKNIEELREIAEFTRITNAGKVESHPHDVKITKESPNYKT